MDLVHACLKCSLLHHLVHGPLRVEVPGEASNLNVLTLLRRQDDSLGVVEPLLGEQHESVIIDLIELTLREEAVLI